MMPITWPAFADIHPFAPADQTEATATLIARLETLAGDAHRLRRRVVAAQCRQPGRIRRPAGDPRLPRSRAARRQRDVCLIPSSAHGTNPASAAMAGLQVVVVGCDRDGNVDLADLRAKAEQHAERLAALMVTYPSTHGVFEAAIRDICAHRPRAWRPGLHGRRQHERAGRADQSRPRSAPTCAT